MSATKTPRKGRFSWPLLFVVLGAIAFLAGWLAPNHYPPWASIHNEAGMFIALPAFAAAFLTRRKALYFDKAPALFFGALICIVWLQWRAGLIAYSGDAAMSSFYLVGLVLAWWLGTNSATDQTQMESAFICFAALLVAAAIISCLIAMLQWLGLANVLGNFVAEREPNGRSFANLAQPNHLATLQLMGLVMSCLLYVHRRLNMWQLLTLVVFLSFGSVMTESRAALLSAGVLGVFFLWLGRRHWGLGGWKAVTAWWSLLLLLASTWKPLNETLLFSSPRSVTLGAMVQDSPRITIWSQMIAAIEQAPWVGYGWRQTVVAQKAGANFVEGVLPTDYAHSVILDMLLWVGIPMGLLVLLIAAWWLVRAARRTANATQFLLLAGTLPVLVHSLVEFPFAYAYFLFPVGWLLGATNALQNVEHKEIWQLPARIGRVVLASCVVAFTGMCVWVAVEYVQAEEDHRVMRFEMRKVGRTPVGYEAPRLVLLNQLGEMLQLARIEPHPDMSPEEMERMRVANASFEWATLHLRYVVALGLNGRPEEASRQLKNLRALYGARSYAPAVAYLQELRDNKYPQLAAVKLP